MTIRNSGASKAMEVTVETAPGNNFALLDKGAFQGELSGGESNEKIWYFG